jgi:hypothetical protein
MNKMYGYQYPAFFEEMDFLKKPQGLCQHKFFGEKILVDRKSGWDAFFYDIC